MVVEDNCSTWYWIESEHPIHDEIVCNMSLRLLNDELTSDFVFYFPVLQFFTMEAYLHSYLDREPMYQITESDDVYIDQMNKILSAFPNIGVPNGEYQTEEDKIIFDLIKIIRSMELTPLLD